MKEEPLIQDKKMSNLYRGLLELPRFGWKLLWEYPHHSLFYQSLIKSVIFLLYIWWYFFFYGKSPCTWKSSHMYIQLLSFPEVHLMIGCLLPFRLPQTRLCFFYSSPSIKGLPLEDIAHQLISVLSYWSSPMLCCTYCIPAFKLILRTL